MQRHFRRFVRFVLVGLVLAMLLKWVAIPTATPPALGQPQRSHPVRQVTVPSDPQEVAMGREVDIALRQDGLLLYQGDTNISAYINSIGQRLAQASDRPTLPYTFQIVQDNEINAFATMGGFVYINTGLIQAADNEAALAGVIAHEIGHIGGRHTLKAILKQAQAQRIARRGSPARRQQISRVLELRLLAYSREDEYDADQRGYHTLGRSGYDPDGYIALMAELDAITSRQPEFLSTHPDPGNRVDLLNSLVASYPYPHADDDMDNQSYQTHIAGL